MRQFSFFEFNEPFTSLIEYEVKHQSENQVNF